MDAPRRTSTPAQLVTIVDYVLHGSPPDTREEDRVPGVNLVRELRQLDVGGPGALASEVTATAAPHEVLAALHAEYRRLLARHRAVVQERDTARRALAGWLDAWTAMRVAAPIEVSKLDEQAGGR